MENNKDQNEFLTLKEAAALLKMHPESIRRWHLKDGLPVYKHGKIMRIRKQELLDFLSKHKK